jgi:alpha-1,2-mannosyltransferase
LRDEPHTGFEARFWLTERRVRALATILSLCLWSVYVWNLSTPGLRDRAGNLKGTDFVHFYALGSLALEHRGSDLYDSRTQTELIARRVPAAAGIEYLPLYPPQISIFFALLARLRYVWALAVWWGFTAVVYGACCYALWRACPNLCKDSSTVLLLAIAYPAFFHLIAWGQTSALALACFTVIFFLLRARREFLAGLVLGCLIFKPQLGLAAALVFISVGAWRTVAGAVISASAQLALGIVYYGLQPLRQWINVLVHVGSVLPWLEPRPYQTHSLRTFWSMLIPWPHLSVGLYVVTSIVSLGLTVAVWKRGDSLPLALRHSALLLTTVLVAPHLTVYDLVILAPMLLLSADWLIGQGPSSPQRWLANLLFLVYILPLFGFTALWTHVQLSVLAMAAAICMIWSLSRQIDRRSAATAIS